MRAAPGGVFCCWFVLSSGAAASLRRVALWKGQSRSLVVCSSRRACPREYGASLRGQIHPLACWELCPDGGPVRRVSVLLVPAYLFLHWSMCGHKEMSE